MAKGSAMGLWRGKKGSSVFYYLKNSNNSQKQGIRERVYTVSNPQTDAQLEQRVLMAPIRNIYNALQTVIRRSWQGLEYGGKGTQEFFKLALRVRNNVPYLQKGDTRAVPGQYQISRGSIGEVTTHNEDADIFGTSLICNVVSSPNMTWGEMSASLIANNDVKQGDQLTFIWCQSNSSTGSDADARYIWTVKSVYVDSESTIEATDFESELGIPFITDEGRLTVSLDITGEYIVATACIVSRLSDTGKYERSSSTIRINLEYLAYWLTIQRKSFAKMSYKTGIFSTRSTNWPTDPNEEPGSSGGEVIDGSYTITGLTGNKAMCNGKKALVRINVDTQEMVGVYIKDDSTLGDCLVDADDRVSLAYSVEMQAVGLTKSDVPALANLPSVAYE